MEENKSQRRPRKAIRQDAGDKRKDRAGTRKRGASSLSWLSKPPRLRMKEPMVSSDR